MSHAGHHKLQQMVQIMPKVDSTLLAHLVFDKMLGKVPVKRACKVSTVW